MRNRSKVDDYLKRREKEIKHEKEVLDDYYENDKKILHKHKSMKVNTALIAESEELPPLRPVVTTSKNPCHKMKIACKRVALILNSRKLKRGSKTKESLPDPCIILEGVRGELNGMKMFIDGYLYYFQITDKFFGEKRIREVNPHFFFQNTKTVKEKFFVQKKDGEEEKEFILTVDEIEDKIKESFSRIFYGPGKKRAVVLAKKEGIYYLRNYEDGKCTDGLDLKLYEVRRGDLKYSENVWSLRMHTNTAYKQDIE